MRGLWSTLVASASNVVEGEEAARHEEGDLVHGPRTALCSACCHVTRRDALPQTHQYSTNPAPYPRSYYWAVPLPNGFQPLNVCYASKAERSGQRWPGSIAGHLG